MKTPSKLFFTGLFLSGCALFLSFNAAPETVQKKVFSINDSTSLSDVYEKLGRIKINAVNTSIDGVSAQKGADIVHKGISAKQNGEGRTKLQSPYFKCTACHNTEKEFEDLHDISPENRLAYAKANQLPFLQGTTFYGIVNRTNFYNDDYQKKYAGVKYIKESYTDIRKAIQVCAEQCSQGRELADWEVESVLAYFWTLELKVKDLKLNTAEKTTVEAALKNTEQVASALHLLEGKYMRTSPAHFENPVLPQALTDADKKNSARLENGKTIYNLSCKHCHEEKRYSFFALDDSKNSFKYLNRQIKKNSKNSIFKITREGTYPLNGKRAYMPHYPIEKLSNQQLNDLYLYIASNSKNL